MKKNRLSMNLIMVLAMAAVAVCVLVCAIVIFVQTYRSALLRNAETTSRQAIAQVSSTMEEYLEDMNDSVALLTEYLDLPVRQREARFETFLEIKPDVVAITTYDADGQMKNCYSLGHKLREHIWENLSLDAARLDEYADGYVSAPHVMSIFEESYPWVVTLIEPVATSEGEQWVAVDIGCSNISGYINGVGIGQRGYCFLEDLEGNLVYHPQQQLIYSELKQENTALTASLPDGPHVEGNTIYTVQTLASGNWRVVGVSSVQELITDGLQEVLRISVISALFILAAMLMLSVLLSQMLSKPIQNLVSAMRSFERDADNFSYEPVMGVREVQNLSVSFEHMVHRIQKLMATVRSEEINLRKTELKALQAQINPHFLYNTLNTISYYVRSDPETARRLIQYLSDYFRHSLNNPSKLIPLSEELHVIECYTELERARFGDRLQIEYDFPKDKLDDIMVPPLLLQPLVENAVIHGIFKRPEGGQIKAGLIEHDDHYKIYVYDTGVGIARAKRKRLLRDHKRRDHIGLINVHQRLISLFGERSGLHIISRKGRGTLVFTNIPKVTAEEEKAAEQAEAEENAAMNLSPNPTV